jgi:hypothetical protein
MLSVPASASSTPPDLSPYASLARKARARCIAFAPADKLIDDLNVWDVVAASRYAQRRGVLDRA